MEADTCATCRWWRRQNHIAGRCTRYPPQVTDLVGRAAFPLLDHTDHCGEHSHVTPSVLQWPVRKPTEAADAD